MNMKKLNVTLAILVAAVMAGNAQTVSSEPVGYVTVKIIAGTGTAKSLAMFHFRFLKKICPSQVRQEEHSLASHQQPSQIPLQDGPLELCLLLPHPT